MSPEASRGLATSLAPILAEVCENRLSSIHWFKTDWQRGGAATGRAQFEGENGPSEVVVKLPVNQRELTWTRRLQPIDTTDDDPVVPRLFASGAELNGYDLAWIVIERFPYGPLGRAWDDHHVNRMADAIARFHRTSSVFTVDQCPSPEDWHGLLEKARRSVTDNQLEPRKQWRQALKIVHDKLDCLLREWRSREMNQWLHGDAHLANAMARRDGNGCPVALIDLAEIHAGHWIEDAVYLERQLWGRPDLMKKHKPVKAVAAARKRHGLPVETEYPRLAMVRRTLLAATAPSFLATEGSPKHLETCLRWLELAPKDLQLV